MKKVLTVIFSISFIIITGCNSDTTGYNVEQTNLELNIVIDSMSNFEMNNITQAFNEKYPDIKLVNYYPTTDDGEGVTEQEYSDFVKKTSAEIMAGKGPDIFVINRNSPFFEDIGKSIKSGAFYDLNNFLKGNNNYNEDDYIDAAMQAGKYDGGQYLFPVSIDAPIWVTTKEIIDETGIDLDNCKDYFGFMNELDKYHKQAGDSNKRSSIAPMVNYNLELLNAYDNKVTFNTDKVKQALQTYKECEKNAKTIPVSSYIEDSYIGLFAFDKVIFSDSMFGFNSLLLSAFLNERFEPILVPKYNSHGQIQTTINCGLVVNQNSSNLDNVAKFFDVMLTNNNEINALDDAEYKAFEGYDGKFDNISQEDRYIYTTLRHSIPTNKLYIKEELELREKKYNDGYDYNIYDIEKSRKVTPISNDYYKQFSDICDSIEVCTLPAGVTKKVYDIFTLYFKDEKSLDECIKSAQSTMEIYLSE